MTPDRPAVSRVFALLRTELRTAWQTHRPYVFLSALLLFGSMPVGVFFWQQSRGISQLPFAGVVTNPLAQQFSAATLLGDNLTLFSLLVVGALSAGVLTAIGLVVQGIVAGYFLALSAGGYGSGLLFVAVVPHGVAIAVAIVLSSAVSFRLVGSTLGRLVGVRGPLDSGDWRRSGFVLVCGVLALTLSALIEGHVTFRLTELLF